MAMPWDRIKVILS